jgi:hypothetical protein
MRNADSVIAGVSSMSIGSGATSRDTCTNLSKSRWVCRRDVSVAKTCDSSLSRRVANCSALVFSETPAVAFDGHSDQQRASASSALAALTATVASDILPMPGRPAGSPGRWMQSRPSWHRGHCARWSVDT